MKSKENTTHYFEIEEIIVSNEDNEEKSFKESYSTGSSSENFKEATKEYQEKLSDLRNSNIQSFTITLSVMVFSKGIGKGFKIRQESCTKYTEGRIITNLLND